MSTETAAGSTNITAFSLNDAEAKAREDWIAKHRRRCKFMRESWPAVTFSAGGGIGTRITLRCGCGAERDISDYASW